MHPFDAMLRAVRWWADVYYPDCGPVQVRIGNTVTVQVLPAWSIPPVLKDGHPHNELADDWLVPLVLAGRATP